MFDSISKYFPKSTDRIMSPVLSTVLSISYCYIIIFNNVTVTEIFKVKEEVKFILVQDITKKSICCICHFVIENESNTFPLF